MGVVSGEGVSVGTGSLAVGEAGCDGMPEAATSAPGRVSTQPVSISSGSVIRSRLASWSSGQRSGSPRCYSARCQRESPDSTVTVMGSRRIGPGGGG